MCVGMFLVRVGKTKEGIRSGKVEREKEVEESGGWRWRWNKSYILSRLTLCYAFDSLIIQYMLVM